MFTSHSREKHVANLKGHDFLNSGFAVMHIDRSVEHCEYLFTIVYMPLIRPVGPVEAGCGTTHVCYVVSSPGSSCGEVFAPNYSHFLSLSNV